MCRLQRGERDQRRGRRDGPRSSRAGGDADAVRLREEDIAVGRGAAHRAAVRPDGPEAPGRRPDPALLRPRGVRV